MSIDFLTRATIFPTIPDTDSEVLFNIRGLVHVNTFLKSHPTDDMLRDILFGHVCAMKSKSLAGTEGVLIKSPYVNLVYEHYCQTNLGETFTTAVPDHGLSHGLILVDGVLYAKPVHFERLIKNKVRKISPFSDLTFINYCIVKKYPEKVFYYGSDFLRGNPGLNKDKYEEFINYLVEEDEASDLILSIVARCKDKRYWQILERDKKYLNLMYLFLNNTESYFLFDECFDKLTPDEIRTFVSLIVDCAIATDSQVAILTTRHDCYRFKHLVQ